MYIFSICENPNILRVILFIKLLLNVVKFMIPMGLIIMVSLDLVKGVISGEDFGKILKASGNKILAAMIIFLLPTIVNFVLVLVDENTSYESCWTNANNDDIKHFQDVLDEKKRLEEEEKKKNDVSNQYDPNNSYTSSINGIMYNLYNQSDSKWKGVYFGNGQDIDQNGCMITSVAVISSSVDPSITPLTVFNSKYRHSFPYTGINALTNGVFSCSHEWVTKSNVIDNLKKGNVLVIMVKDKSKFTGSQHYMSLIDISSDGSKIYVGNSYGSGKGNYNRTGWFSTADIIEDIHELNVCIPSQELYDRFN